jgi:endonuclease/exonuclease/phosphatase family metal-dependent hydrolase
MDIIARGLTDLQPDVVGLQEVREVDGHLANQARTLGDRVGMGFVFAPAASWGGGVEGVAILSRHRVVEHEHRVLPSEGDEPRVILRARIETARGPVDCFTTHLNYRMTHGVVRERQVTAVDTFVTEQTGPLPRVLMGDFNATPEHDEIRFLRGLHTLDGRRVFYQDAYARRHPVESEAGFTWARRNPFTERMRWLERDRRLDYIFVTPITRDGRGVVQDCRIVFDRPDHDGCYASDHFGVLADVQLAPLTPLS